ncbi:MAG: hypothetical protein GW947_01700 [Candidatus Pacebacteria bacterium]|nr:hypothetical protein [Candidatus Paceibacterota bacterium]PIR60952.1 MAG: hypothetical protein COU68_02045 [Candidatus Pacebacteria bacterium CG10_big_fil_rev_8_21_14_0_10_45_6]
MQQRFELAIGLVLLLVLVVAANPMHFLMPKSMTAVLVVVLASLFLVFLSFVWRERAEDEREAIHINKAGRLSFFVGSLVLVTGIGTQITMHEVDPWLLAGLASMVLAKLISRLYQHYTS